MNHFTKACYHTLFIFGLVISSIGIADEAATDGEPKDEAKTAAKHVKESGAYEAPPDSKEVKPGDPVAKDSAKISEKVNDGSDIAIGDLKPLGDVKIKQKKKYRDKPKNSVEFGYETDAEGNKVAKAKPKDEEELDGKTKLPNSPGDAPDTKGSKRTGKKFRQTTVGKTKAAGKNMDGTKNDRQCKDGDPITYTTDPKTGKISFNLFGKQMTATLRKDLKGKERQLKLGAKGDRSVAETDKGVRLNFVAVTDEPFDVPEEYYSAVNGNKTGLTAVIGKRTGPNSFCVYGGGGEGEGEPEGTEKADGT